MANTIIHICLGGVETGKTITWRISNGGTWLIYPILPGFSCKTRKKTPPSVWQMIQGYFSLSRKKLWNCGNLLNIYDLYCELIFVSSHRHIDVIRDVLQFPSIHNSNPTQIDDKWCWRMMFLSYLWPPSPEMYLQRAFKLFTTILRDKEINLMQMESTQETTIIKKNLLILLCNDVELKGDIWI